jgi:hypothetical protein
MEHDARPQKNVIICNISIFTASITGNDIAYYCTVAQVLDVWSIGVVPIDTIMKQ